MDDAKRQYIDWRLPINDMRVSMSFGNTAAQQFGTMEKTQMQNVDQHKILGF